MSRRMIFADLFLLLLSALISIHPSSTSAQSVVIDMDDKPIENGGPSSYYVLASDLTLGGGVGIAAATGDETCPLSIAQYPDEDVNGLAVTITSLAASRSVPIGRVDIRFTLSPPCASPPSNWTFFDGGLQEGTLVKINGHDNHPVNGYFEIAGGHYNGSYTLSFCLSDIRRCGTIGIIKDENGKRFLGVTTDNQFDFVLQNTIPRSSSAATA